VADGQPAFCSGRWIGIWTHAKECTLVEYVVFTDNDALQAFRAHPGHRETFELMRRIADWVVGDIMVEYPVAL